MTEPSSLPYWLENLLFPAGAVLLAVGFLLVVAGGIPLKPWRSPSTATLLQFWGATVFVEGLLCLAAVIELPWLIVGIIAVLALVAVPRAAWRRTRQLRIRQAAR